MAQDKIIMLIIIKKRKIQTNNVQLMKSKNQIKIISKAA